MYIEPNTTIKLYSGIPLDNTYNHTWYFPSLEVQTAYFHSGRAKYTLASNSYQRVERGKMRIEKKADDVYDCNYLAFQNINYGNKWFYAFITGVEFINNVTCEITFEIDSMQTYLFDVEIKECFVEREHSETDEIGDNINPEPVELGEYISDDFGGTDVIHDYSVVVASTGINSVYPFKGGAYSNVFSGVEYTAFPFTTQGLHDLIQSLTDVWSQAVSDRMVGIFMIPTCFVSENVIAPPASYTVTKSKNITALGTYTSVKNKKLFTYPYNFLAVNNMQGDETIYKYEYFSGADCVFTLAGDYNIMAQAFLVPMNYKGIPANYDESSVINTSVQCSSNTASFIESVGNSALQIATSYKQKDKEGNRNAVGVANGVLNAVRGFLHADNYKGVSNSSVLAAFRLLDFAFMHRHITPQFAQQIDDFFTMYGYTCNRVKVPNTHARPYWNYVKTRGCVAIGSAPSDDIRKICQIYDKGITFWQGAVTIGDYSLDNSPL